ncbi:hypothetical protein ElyMa_005807200 [Elysia marginata]|uniref:Reverse transcriptase domain-containing protein n=1 Tax=Elysia marginata TaxID=1093978 RepID=A0AAV4FWK9_9GAST|nr:hypothetical protein ElyMa_005807200 [Elysia marginata]
MDFLWKVHIINNSGPLPPDTMVCTRDISGLYTNIPHEEGIAACRTALEAGRERGAKPSSSFLCRLLHPILSLTSSLSLTTRKLQVHGTAMGTCTAPTVANIFMGTIETGLFCAFPDKPLVWLRYKDDIFLIWTHGRTKLESFIAHANTFHATIKFTSNISDTQIPFLDVMVSLYNNTLHTDLYSKPTDAFNYLHWSSCHPFHTKSSIPYSLAFRLRRICSCEETLTRRLTELTEHLTRRSFPLKHTQKAMHKAKETPRSTAIQRRRLPETQKKPQNSICHHIQPSTTQHFFCP